jgi:hypothetical protein
VERRIRLIVLVSVLLASLASRQAFGQESTLEAQARALQKSAMEDDYLNVDLEKAIEKLNQAISECGADRCGGNLRALLRRDLAVVYSTANKRAEAVAMMSNALKIYGSIELDPNFKTREISVIFAEAKKQGGAGSAAAPTAVAVPSGAPPADFTHTPAPEQVVRTPLPIYVEYGGSEAIAKVIVRYKGYGMTEFKTIELKKLVPGWGANLPCLDVQQGALQYYIQGFDANNNPVAEGGDRVHPYTVPIKKQISGSPPHLPAEAPLVQCAEAGDCPPDFPGCKSAGGAGDSGKRGAGEDCGDDSECRSGACKDAKCTASNDDEGETKPRLRRFWVGLDVSLDFDLLSFASNACALNSGAMPANGYYCTNGDGNNYPARPVDPGVKGTPLLLQNSALVPNREDTVHSGMSPGNLRFMASFDYALNYNLMIGARVGYAALGYPGSAAGNDGKGFPPIHLEGRLTYVFGQYALAKAGVAPVGFVAAGAATFSSEVGVPILECDGSMGAPVALVAGSCPVGAKEAAKSVSAWKVGGPGFIALGGGLRYAFSSAVAAELGVKLTAAFGNGFLFVPTPELGVQIGF